MHRLFWSPIVTHTVKGKILSTGFNCWTRIKDFSSVSALRKKETLPHMIENTGVARVKLLWWAYKSNTDCNLKARLHCVICICSISRTGKWQCPVVFYFMWMFFTLISVKFLPRRLCNGSAASSLLKPQVYLALQKWCLYICVSLKTAKLV